MTENAEPAYTTRTESRNTTTVTLPEDGIRVTVDVSWKVWYLAFMALVIIWGALAKLP